MCREKKILEQIELMKIVQQKANINLVNCGSCGDVFLHEIKPLTQEMDLEELDLTCPYCDFKSEPCDFPDFFYEGMELSEVYSGRKLVDDFYNKASTKLMGLYFPDVKYHRDNETSQKMTYELELYNNGVTNWNVMLDKIAKLVNTPFNKIESDLNEFLKK